MGRKLSDKMEELANALADKTLSSLPPDKDTVDIFGKLTAYYLGTEKLGNVDEKDADANSSGFDGIKSRLKAV